MRSLLELVRRKKPLSPTMVDVNEVIENCIALLRYKAMYKEIDIRKTLCSDLPKIPDLGLESVFSNILSNALDALNEQGSISITTSMNDNFIEITVFDTGCGIPKDNIGRIFDPFFTTKEISKGSGLGLSICCDIVKSYNGKIDVVSEPGKGTKFTVSIPYANRR
jgi:two-component system NtrC family sensor kinase